MSQSIYFRESDGAMCFLEDLVSDFESQVKSAVEREIIGKSDLALLIHEDDIFSSCFPKTCRACGTVYKTREDYLKLTNEAKSHQALNELRKDRRHVIECRSCICGNSLVLISECRRDTSAFGIECRAYFNICVEKLIHTSGFSQEDAEDLTRVIFRSVLSQAKEAG